jgi:hypothetical protein
MPTKPKSSKKSATARANGAKSHGPATPEGRARSSQNALRHGLSTRGATRRPGATRAAALPTVSVVLDDESPADFQRLLDSYLDEFTPTSPLEVELIETMVSARWRLRRLANIETTLLANEMETTVDDLHNFFSDVDREPTIDDHLAYAFKLLAGGASLHLLNRYEGTIGRSYARAFKQLQLLRSLRARVQPNEPKQSLPTEPLCGRAPALEPIPTNKVDAKALPAPKSLPVEPSGDRVLQTPPQPTQIRLESHKSPDPARQIPAP